VGTSLKTRDSKRVLVLELLSAGHHTRYVRWLLESEIGKSAEVILASRKEMFDHPEIKACSTPFTPHVVDIGPKLDALLNKDVGAVELFVRSWMIGDLYRKTCSYLARVKPIDFVIVPYLDNCILGLAIPREAFHGIPWTTITMRTMFHYGDMGVIAPQPRFSFLRRLLFDRIMRQKSAVAVLTIDPTLAEFAEKPANRLLRKVVYLPDPVPHYTAIPSKVEARRQLAIPIDARLVLLYGELSARKGIGLLLQALADAECSREVHVLLAGRYSEGRQITESEAFQLLLAEGRLHAIEGYLGDEQEQQVLAAADCLWVKYCGFYGMSSIMVLSGVHGLPVIATQEGVIGYFSRKYGIGVTVDSDNRRAVVAALNRMVTAPEIFLQLGKNGKSVFERHTVREFQQIVSQQVLQSWS
jgi:glycosyltransferase involved in cell wall biosynthesis